MIVVVIIGLLAAMAIPAFARVKERSLASRMANDIRQCESAFQRYALENGGWPPATAPGVTPVGMAGYLPPAYNQITAVGGNFSWSGPAAKLYLINTPASADPIMLRVDAMMDDGDVTTGDMIKSGSGYTIFVH